MTNVLFSTSRNINKVEVYGNRAQHFDRQKRADQRN